jgi:hypothetical protein
MWVQEDDFSWGGGLNMWGSGKGICKTASEYSENTWYEIWHMVVLF